MAGEVGVDPGGDGWTRWWRQEEMDGRGGGDNGSVTPKVEGSSSYGGAAPGRLRPDRIW